MANSDSSCTWGCDPLTRGLGKIGVNRSMLVTLALVPFAWNGVVWAANAVTSLWDLATGAVGQ